MDIENFDRRIREIADRIFTKKFANISLYFLTTINIMLSILLINYFFISGYFYLLNLLGLNIGVLLYILHGRLSSSSGFKYSRKLDLILWFLFMIFLVASYLSILFSINYRSIYFYLFITLSFLVILPKLFLENLDNKNTIYILSQMILLNFFMRISLFIMHGTPPWWDPYYHFSVSAQVYESGSIPNISGRIPFPLYYIFNSEIWSFIFGRISYGYVVFNAIVLSISLIFPYLIIERITKSKRAGLFSSVLLLITFNFFQLTNYQTPHLFALILAILSIYFLYKLISENTNYKSILLFTISSTSSFIFQPSNGLFLSIISISVLVLRSLFNVKRIPILMIYPAFVFVYLTNLASDYLNSYVASILFPSRPFNVENPIYPGFTLNIQNLSYYTLSHFWYLTISMFAGLGIMLLLISGKKDYFLPIIAIITAAYSTGILFSELATPQTIGTLSIITAELLLGGVALKNNFKKAFAIFIIILLAFTFFSSTLLSDDNPYFGKYGFYTQSLLYTNDEGMNAAKFLLYYMHSNSRIGSTDDMALTACCSIQINYVPHIDPTRYLVINNTSLFINRYSIERWTFGFPAPIWNDYIKYLNNQDYIDLIYSNSQVSIYYAEL